MDKKMNDFSMQKAIQMANTPAGKQLIAMLQQTDPSVLEKAKAQATSGNYSQLSKTLAPLLASEDVQKLLKSLGG